MKQIKIAMVAEAAVKNEIVPYTGTFGLFASMQIQFPEPVIDIANELGIELDSNAIHTTVCYSKKDAVPLDTLPAIPTSRVFPAVCNEVAHWIGHKGQTCVVLKLISHEIVQVNAELQRLGALHTFTPYAPHVTLSDDGPAITEAMQEKIDAINKRLAREPLFLTFDRYQVGDQDN